MQGQYQKDQQEDRKDRQEDRKAHQALSLLRDGIILVITPRQPLQSHVRLSRARFGQRRASIGADYQERPIISEEIAACCDRRSASCSGRLSTRPHMTQPQGICHTTREPAPQCGPRPPGSTVNIVRTGKHSVHQHLVIH
jgi:hypothetical protein